ncbi:beta strand repeat-containing protein [Holophaga foetida]|uniref:beta strand repeat-containing protein n=1 Tax=Holophaga foetida TaxID=35839 RepID=UPI0002473AF3|nr:carboxypeptidase-like regulatory domain-containing protein [Holophaga foetida]
MGRTAPYGTQRSPWTASLLATGIVALATACGGGASSGATSTASASTYTISGTVSGGVASGVTLTLSGASSATKTTGSSGTYTFSGLSAGSYTVAPTLTGYTFSPTSSSITLSNADVTGTDFTSSASTSTLGDRTDYSSVSLTSGGTYSASTAGVSGQYYSYSSTTAGTPAIKVAPGGSLTLNNSKATKSGSTTDLENSGFYGFNVGVLASSSSSASSYVETSKTTTVTLTDCTISTAASGANGAFAFGEGATVNLDHVTIVTTGDSNSRGVDATYGGTVNITNSTLSTLGGSCAALASDRYTGASAPTINATNCTGTTAGSGSPGIYCTGTFTVTDCTLSATGSEAACIEGLNSITLNNTSLSGVAKWGVIVYQSMSGDSTVGTGRFTMTGGTLTNGFAKGPAFFVCDTDAVITLNGATIVNASDTLLVAGTASAASSYIDNVNSSWGSDGGVVTFVANNQTLVGKVILCDSSSTLAMTLTASTLTGPIDTDNVGGTKTLALDASSKWTATANSNITTLSGVVLSAGVPTNVDASSGVTITYTSMTNGSGGALTGTYTLSSGGTLKAKS